MIRENDLTGKTPLRYDEFKEYEVVLERPKCRNLDHTFKFSNGYGASVIKHFGSFGFEQDLFELAVVMWGTDNHFWSIDTPILDDTIAGCLTNDQVLKLLKEIKEYEEVV